MAKKITAEQDVNQETNQEEGLVIGQINNEVEPDSKEVFVAWCNFTTMKMTKMEDGSEKLQSTQIMRGDEITAAEVPMIWINDAIAKRHLISKKDKDTLTNKDLAKRGYSV